MKVERTLDSRAIAAQKIDLVEWEFYNPGKRYHFFLCFGNVWCVELEMTKT